MFSLLLIALLVYLFIKYKGFENRRGSSDPVNVIKERYARGEVSREEYLRIVGDLEK